MRELSIASKPSVRAANQYLRFKPVQLAGTAGPAIPRGKLQLPEAAGHQFEVAGSRSAGSRSECSRSIKELLEESLGINSAM
jgi:hypothetical protein